MPTAWSATVLLHPFSPPLSTDPKPDTPFFQLCVANIVCVQNMFLSAQIKGCDYGQWWYMITPETTELSTDNGLSWHSLDMGWSLPHNWFGAQAANASCAGASPLNWMSGNSVNWWKIPVPIPQSQLKAATWMWFDPATDAPLRMMFGYGPPLPTKGDRTQLALFQMFSFTYFPVFRALSANETPDRPTEWTEPQFEGFALGNPNGYKDFVFSGNFGMTAHMTPVNEAFNPLPTRVLYVWKPDSEYATFTDRAQSTIMNYHYNPNQPIASQEALLTGPAPASVSPKPPYSAKGFLNTINTDGSQSCVGGAKFPFPQEPPNWLMIPAEQATIHATITNNPVVAPNNVVTVFSVLFPPAKPNYPEATYLWTWYSPIAGTDGTQSRPVTFMQSQSGVGLGTSLALADYFYHQNFSAPIDPANFVVPAACANV
jgi:hypothetical protein